MPRQIFKGRVLAVAGPLPGQLTMDNLKHWTRIRKGGFSEDIDETVTHLLCTHEQFHKRVPRVKEALKLGKRLHIVHYDWFEFSTVREKREPEKEYSMKSILATENATKRENARIEKGERDGEKFVNTSFFHIYHDRDFFPYQIDITRNDEATGDIGQRYNLCLWESDAKPHLYWFTAKFLKKKGSQPSYHRPSPCSGKWRQEMDLFMDFFRIKTGIEWQDRVIKENTMPSSFFLYNPPRGGKPVGRRLRFGYEYCLEANANLRGLPWPAIDDSLPLAANESVCQDTLIPKDEKRASLVSGLGGQVENQMHQQPEGEIDEKRMLDAQKASSCDNSSENSLFDLDVSQQETFASTASGLSAGDSESLRRWSRDREEGSGPTEASGLIYTTNMDLNLADGEDTKSANSVTEHPAIDDSFVSQVCHA